MPFPLVRPAAFGLLAALPALWAAAPAQAQTPQAPAGQAPATGQAPAQAAPAADPVVATVNGQDIRMSDLQFVVGSLPPQYRQMPLQQIYVPLREQLIDGRLLSAEARKAGLQNDPEVKRRMAQLEERVIQEAYLDRELAKKVTPDTLKARYDAMVKGAAAEEEVHAAHILVKTEAEAKAVIDQLKKGGDFAKIAKDKSTDPGSGAQGGDLGWFKKGDMVAEFANAAFALKPGETTPAAVKTEFGWHVIKLIERRTAPAPSFAEVEPELRQEVERDAANQIVTGLKQGAKIERFNPDGTPAPAPQTPAPQSPAR